MAKQQKKYRITRRTLNRLMNLIPKKRRKNVEMGFTDATGFHPIRASSDCSRSRSGEGRQKQTRRARTARYMKAKKRSRYSSMP